MKNCLAMFGVIFLVLLVLGAAFVYSANPGLIADLLPERSGTPEVEITPLSTPVVQNLPTPTLKPSPTAPPDPVEYRTRVLIRAKLFSTTLEAFMNTNNRLETNPAVLTDAEWRSEARTALEELVWTAQGLGSIQPVPAEYRAIADQLSLVGPVAQSLRDHYTRGIASGDRQDFAVAGENLASIREIMKQAQAEMARAGWAP